MLGPLALAAKIEPIEFQNQRALPIRCLDYRYRQFMEDHILSLDPQIRPCKKAVLAVQH